MQNLAGFFSIIYMIRIRFFGPRELNQNGFSGARYGPAGTSRAFPQRSARTLVGQEHAATETSRPMCHGPDPCGRLQRLHPSVTVGGPYWHSVLVLGQYFRVAVITRLTILATIAIDPLFEIIRTFMAINSCTSPRRHTGTSIIRSPTTMGVDPASACFLAFYRRHTHPWRGPPFGFTPERCHCYVREGRSGIALRAGLQKITRPHPEVATFDDACEYRHAGRNGNGVRTVLTTRAAMRCN